MLDFKQIIEEEQKIINILKEGLIALTKELSDEGDPVKRYRIKYEIVGLEREIAIKENIKKRSQEDFERQEKWVADKMRMRNESFKEMVKSLEKLIKANTITDKNLKSKMEQVVNRYRTGTYLSDRQKIDDFDYTFSLLQQLGLVKLKPKEAVLK